MSISNEELKRIQAIKDSEIDCSDIPELDEQFWADAELRVPEQKQAISIRIDPEVLQWFKDSGKGYQTKINAVLRQYYEAQKQRQL